MKNRVFYNGELAGYLYKDGSAFIFEYDQDYVAENNPSIGFNLPLMYRQIVSYDHLHPFFENLVSEGWLLEAQSRGQRIDENDYYNLLINNGSDLIGAITVEKGEA